MRIILRLTLKNAAASKLQAGLIMAIVLIVTALLLTATSISGAFYTMAMAEQLRFSRGTDLRLGEGRHYGTEFSIEYVESLLDDGDVRFADFFNSAQTVAKTDALTRVVRVEATDLDNYLSNHTLKIKQGQIGEATKTGAAIVGQRTADSLGIGAGDTVELFLHGKYVPIFIGAVAEDSGIFSTDYICMLTDFSTMGRGRVATSAYIKFTNSNLYNKYSGIFESNLVDITVSRSDTNSYAVQNSQNITMIMTVAVIFVVIAMMLILYTAYTIIARRRTQDLLLLKSAGATPAQAVLILIFEVALYVIIGALLGLVAGGVLLSLLVKSLLPAGTAFAAHQPAKFVLAFCLSLAISLTSCLPAALRLSLKTIRQLDANPQKIRQKSAKALIAAPVMLVLLAVALVVFGYLSGNQIVVFAVVIAVLAAAFVAFSAPVLLQLFGWLAGRLRQTGSVWLASKNGARLRSIGTVSSLLSMLILLIFLVSHLTGVLKFTTVSYQARFSTDFMAVLNSNSSTEQNRRIADELREIEGVESVGFVSSAESVLFGLGVRLVGVGDIGALKTCTKGVTSAMLNRFENNVNAVIISQDTAGRFGIKIGDYLQVTANGAVHEMFVAGVDRTATEWDAIMYINHEFVEGFTYQTLFLTKAARNASFLDFRSVAESISAEGWSDIFAVEGSEWGGEGSSREGISKMLDVLLGFLVVVAILGIINIAAVTALDRRAEFLLCSVCGMTLRGRIRLAVTEGLMIALVGGIMGIAVSFAFNQIMPIILTLIDRFYVFKLFPSAAIIASIGMAAMLVIWLATAGATAKKHSFQDFKLFRQ